MIVEDIPNSTVLNIQRSTVFCATRRGRRFSNESNGSASSELLRIQMVRYSESKLMGFRPLLGSIGIPPQCVYFYCGNNTANGMRAFANELKRHGEER